MRITLQSAFRGRKTTKSGADDDQIVLFFFPRHFPFGSGQKEDMVHDLHGIEDPWFRFHPRTALLRVLNFKQEI